jgi:radical SAM protein with 4Fe4S-binding SPASM domain
MLPPECPKLVRVYLAVTHRCPLRCRHCYAGAGSAVSPEMTFREIEKIVREMAALDVRELTITGGEPFVRTDILDIIGLCLESGLRLTVLTSGIVDSALLRHIRQRDMELRLSLDGASAETHDYIRGKGNLKEVLRIVRELRSHSRIRLSVHFTVNRANLGEICRIPSLLDQMELRELVVSVIKPVGRAREHPELLLEPELLPLARERIATISRNRRIFWRRYSDKNWFALACPAAFTKCGITPEGNITPCVFLGEGFVGGSLREYSLDHLWRHDDKCRRLRNLSVNPDCLGCARLGTHNGGCRARALYYSGSLDGRDPYCCAVRQNSTNESLASLLWKSGT